MEIKNSFNGSYDLFGAGLRLQNLWFKLPTSWYIDEQKSIPLVEVSSFNQFLNLMVQ